MFGNLWTTSCDQWHVGLSTWYINDLSWEDLEGLVEGETTMVYLQALDFLHNATLLLIGFDFAYLMFESLSSLRTWPKHVSRQLWWGHRIPVFATQGPPKHAGLGHSCRMNLNILEIEVFEVFHFHISWFSKPMIFWSFVKLRYYPTNRPGNDKYFVAASAEEAYTIGTQRLWGSLICIKNNRRPKNVSVVGEWRSTIRSIAFVKVGCLRPSTLHHGTVFLQVHKRKSMGFKFA